MRQRRLAKEMKQLLGAPPEGVAVANADDMQRWVGGRGCVYNARVGSYPIVTTQ